MKNKIYIKGFILLSLLAFTSCSPIAKIVLGIKDFKTYVSNEERFEYYKPFLELQNGKYSVYTFKNWEGIQAVFDSVHVPRIYVENTVTDSVYVLSCYEDIVADIEDINNDKLDMVSIANKKEFINFKNIIDTSTVLTSSEKEIKRNEKWKVYLIHGTFMGKKLRKKTLPVTSIKSLQEMLIIDTSIDGQAPE